MLVTTLVGGRDRPALPHGRMVALPGRGSTFVREQSGPPGAPVLMLLHGWAATADLTWRHCYGPLAQQFRVLAIDHRGHGRGIRHAEPFRLEDCADDVAALAAQLGIERLIPVGYSMGGPIAPMLWQRHRPLVEGLVLCATSAVFGPTPRLRRPLRRRSWAVGDWYRRHCELIGKHRSRGGVAIEQPPRRRALGR